MHPKKAIIILLVLAIIGSVIVFFGMNKKPEITYVTTVAEIGNLVQTVSETGAVKAESELDLNFLNSGHIAKLHTKIGNEVKQGDILAELDYDNLEIKCSEFAANIDVARSNLNKLLAGAAENDIAVSKAGLEQSRVAYEAAKQELKTINETNTETIKQAEKTLADLESSSSLTLTPKEQAVASAKTNLINIKNTYQNAIDDARADALTTIEDKNASSDSALDAINQVLTDDDADTAFSKQDPQYITATNSNYDKAKAQAVLAKSALELVQASSSIDEVLIAVEESYDYLNMVFAALNSCFNGLENTNTSYRLTETELDAFKTGISSQQTLIAVAIALVQSKEQAINTAILNYNSKTSEYEEAYLSAQTNYEQALIDARNNLSIAKLSGEKQKTVAESKVNTTYKAWFLAQAQLDKVLASADEHDVSLKEAQLRQAEAAFESIENQIEKSKIFAPISGTITSIEYQIGEPVMAGGPSVISMLGQSGYEIELLVSEADIAKIEIGDIAEITLDAYGEDIFFPGEIFFIEPAETEVQDVVYYKLKLSFDSLDYQIKSGMTANANITTAEKKEILLIPSRAVIQKNGSGKIVRILNNNQVEERHVTLGLRGDGGMIEVLEGVKAGDVVVTSIKTGK